MNDAQAAEVGREVVKFLNLKPNKTNGRFDTEWGDKTVEGIGRCVQRIVNGVLATYTPPPASPIDPV